MAPTTLPQKRKLGDVDDEPTRPTNPSLIVGGGVPWMKSLDQRFLQESTNTPALQRLGHELMALGKALTPDQVEEERRRGVVKCLERRLGQIFPGCAVHITGSTATGLHLPGGDIDVTLTWRDAQAQFGAADAEDYVLSNIKALLDHDRILGSVKYRRNAQVPIITIAGTYGFYDLDVSFNKMDGLKGVDLVKSVLRTWPVTRPIILLCKIYLERMSLNKPFDGGIGGFTIVVMVAWFVQTHPSAANYAADVDDPRNWGQLLLDFFACFGEHFNYKRFGISLRSGGTYLRRPKEYEDLFVESPFEPGRNMTQGCRLFDLQKAFREGQIALTDAIHFQVDKISSKCDGTWGSYLGRMGEARGSLLHALIGLDDQMMTHATKAERSYPISELRRFLWETHAGRP